MAILAPQQQQLAGFGNPFGAVTPPISTFFGLDPRFLASPAASSSLINPLLYGSSFQQVPVNFGGFYSGIPPIFGGTGFTGFPTTPFNIFAQPSVLFSPFNAGSAFGSGFGTQPFGSNPFGQSANGNFSFNPQPVNPFSFGGFGQTGFVQQNPFGFGTFV